MPNMLVIPSLGLHSICRYCIPIGHERVGGIARRGSNSGRDGSYSSYLFERVRVGLSREISATALPSFMLSIGRTTSQPAVNSSFLILSN